MWGSSLKEVMLCKIKQDRQAYFGCYLLMQVQVIKSRSFIFSIAEKKERDTMNVKIGKSSEHVPLHMTIYVEQHQGISPPQSPPAQCQHVCGARWDPYRCMVKRAKGQRQAASWNHHPSFSFSFTPHEGEDLSDCSSSHIFIFIILELLLSLHHVGQVISAPVWKNEAICFYLKSTNLYVWGKRLIKMQAMAANYVPFVTLLTNAKQWLSVACFPSSCICVGLWAL